MADVILGDERGVPTPHHRVREGVWLLALVGAAIGVGAAVSLSPTAAIIVAFAVGSVALVACGARVLLPCLIVVTFVTGIRMRVAGFNFLPENFLTLGLIAALVIEGKSKELWRAGRDRTALILAAFIAWNAFVSVLQAPDPGRSLRIVGQLGLDWLLLVSIVASIHDSVRLERLAVGSNTALAAVAVGLGIAAAAGLTTLGVQTGDVSGVRGPAHAVYGLSWEANILASTVAVWGFVALSSHDDRVRRIARLCVPLAIGAIAFSLTRAVILSFGLGVILWGLLSGYWAVRTALRTIVAAIGVAVLVLVLAPRIAGPIETRVNNLLQVQGGSGELRLQSAREAFSDLSGYNVLVGLGTNSFGQRHEHPTLPDQPGYLGILPLQIFYDGGLVAVILLGAGLASLRPLSRPGRGRALGVLVVYLGAAATTSPFWFGWTWLLIALAVITLPRDRKGLDGESATARTPRRLAIG